MRLLQSVSMWWGIYKTTRQVRRTGWTAVHISDHPERPRYAYTIGFDETLQHPELIVSDMPARAAFKLFADAFRDIKAGEFRLEDGDAFDTAQGYGIWRKVHESRIYDELWLFFASYRRAVRTGLDSGLQALQLVLPGEHDELPWDAASLALQPPLHLPANNSEVAAGARV
jgi:hypothetical protein